jgi:hypothetical protein
VQAPPRPEHGLQVDQVVHQLVHLVLVLVGSHLVVVCRPIGVDEQLLEARLHGRLTGSRHRTHAPLAVARMPCRSRAHPSVTDSNRTATSTGDPAGTAMMSVPSASGASTSG